MGLVLMHLFGSYDLLWFIIVSVCVFCLLHSNSLPTYWSQGPQQLRTQHPHLLGPGFWWLLPAQRLQNSGNLSWWRELAIWGSVTLPDFVSTWREAQTSSWHPYSEALTSCLPRVHQLCAILWCSALLGCCALLCAWSGAQLEEKRVSKKERHETRENEFLRYKNRSGLWPGVQEAKHSPAWLPLDWWP